MKRFYLHVSVENLDESIRFYSTLFAAHPTVRQSDYAAQLRAADSELIQENDQPCCYAKSDKYWVTDPTGIAWETFHTLGSIPVYGKDTTVFDHGASVVPAARACCVPSASKPNEPCRDPATATENDACRVRSALAR